MTKEFPDSVAIVGAGVFGLSTALAIAKRYPSTIVHLIDRFEPPVPDGSSVDTTRCLRADYNDPVYAELASESMKIIAADEEIAPFFHQCGMSFAFDGNDGDKWGKLWKSSRNCALKVAGPEFIDDFHNNKELFQSIHGESTEPESIDSLGRETWWNKGYRNRANGFIDAARAIKGYYEKTKKFENIKTTFKPVDNIVYKDGTNEAKGVRFTDGSIISSDIVIVAAGAWSAKLVNLDGITKHSAIEVAWYKITEEEAQQWKNMSITTNFTTGINLFPPYEGEVKILRRSAGYKNTITIPDQNPLSNSSTKKTISYPRTIVSNADDWIPEDAETALRENMKEIMPSLASRPFDRTKLCWLTQTTTANFLIDNHPDLKNVVLATGGSAHGWKFVPILGDKVTDFIEGKLDDTLKKMWSWNEKVVVSEDNGSAPRMPGEPQEIGDVVRARPQY